MHFLQGPDKDTPHENEEKLNRMVDEKIAAGGI